MSASSSTPSNEKEECFVIMPFSDPDGYEEGHFTRVYLDIIKPAIEKSGFQAYRSDENKASNLIHLEILKKLIDSPMAVCDLSSRNPNVLFELGIRQAFDKPVALIQEWNTPKIFDIATLSTVNYKRERVYHEVLRDQEIISQAISETYKSSKSQSSVNSLVKLLAIEPAKLREIDELQNNPAIQLVLSEVNGLKQEIRSFFAKGSSYQNEHNSNDNFAEINIKRKRQPDQDSTYLDSLLNGNRKALEMIKNLYSNDEIERIKYILDNAKIQVYHD